MPFHSTPTSEKICYGVVLVHPGEFILPELGGKLGRYADEKVRARGVEIHAKSKVATVRPRQIELTNGEKIISSTLVWTAGTSPNPILDLVACAKERGRIKVNPHLEVEGQNGLWALGDCALVPDPATGDYCPPTAQHASREGKVLAHNIIASVNAWRTDEVLNMLDKMNAIEEVIVVGIHPHDRMNEYTMPGYEDYGRFLVEKLRPVIEGKYRTLTGPTNTAAMGSSRFAVLFRFILDGNGRRCSAKWPVFRAHSRIVIICPTVFPRNQSGKFRFTSIAAGPATTTNRRAACAID